MEYHQGQQVIERKSAVPYIVLVVFMVLMWAGFIAFKIWVDGVKKNWHDQEWEQKLVEKGIGHYDSKTKEFKWNEEATSTANSK